MSTSSGNAVKGEKGKKFQSLKINLCTANKQTEPEQQQQHKSSIQRKQHGMTSLGKVPTARRPTNLPSEKAEHGGNDPSVNLVPTGGPGWGNKQNESAPTTPSLVQSSNPSTNVSVNNVTTTGMSQQVPHAQLYPPIARMPPPQMGSHAPVHHAHTELKTWATMIHGGDSPAPNFLTPQSPLFQHEFPSLSSNSETSSAATPVTATATQKSTASTTTDTQYGPGLSLRPQTEGSWIQGGSRPLNSMNHAAGNQSATAPVQARPMGPFPPHAGPDGVRNNLGPSGVGAAQAGLYPQSVPPPQFGGMMPTFMLQNSYPPGSFPPNFPAPMKGMGQRPPYGTFAPPHSSGERFMQPGANANSSKRTYDDEDTKIRPIVKEEDLNHMASIGNDVGWAAHDDIDYNQKLKFSDDEDDDKGKDQRNKNRTRTQPTFRASDKPSEKKDSIDKETDFRSSKESLKDRETLYSVDQRNPEIKKVWETRRMISSTTSSTTRYQIPANGRFVEDDDAWQEKRRQKKEEMNIIIQRAKERKEEEEKRFNEQQLQAASLKLKQLEATMEANSYGNKENKFPSGNERSLDMLPPWEKEKYQPPPGSEETRKLQPPAPVPVVKDASEFRELTQLMDRSNFVKKDIKERENVQQIGNSRTFAPPRFQGRQNTGSFSNSSSGPTRSIISPNMQFSSKNTNFNITRLKSDNHSEKDREWKHEDSRKDREIDRYGKESSQERDYGYGHGHDHKYENKFTKEYDSKSKYYNERDEHSSDFYGRDYDRESNYSSKNERKISESERDKLKSYDNRRYSESENQEKEVRRRSYDEMEKSRHYDGPSSRSPRTTFTENDNRERKRSREETLYENSKGYNVDRDYSKKIDVSSREKDSEYKKESEAKRDHDHEFKKESYKDERKSPSTYDDRLTRNERFPRESRESLRDESYIIQESRTYAWPDDGDMDEKKSRNNYYREDRGDRYSHAQRHVPKPIPRSKLDKEFESESKGNLTALVRCDKKIELKKIESEDTKDKHKSEKTAETEAADASNHKSESQAEIPSAWKRSDKIQKDDSKVTQLSSAGANDPNADNTDDAKGKDEKKDTSKTSSKDDQAEKSSEEKRANERRKAENRNKDPRNWTRYAAYQTSSYSSGRTNAKPRRTNRGASTKGTSRRDSKYSESDYSDEISGSGREDRNSHSERDKNRPVKSKRYDREDRYDYRMDERDYGSSRGRSNRDYYKPPQRGRNSGYRAPANVGKRMDGYGPPSSRSAFGGTGSEEKRTKPSKDSSSTSEQNAAEKKNEGTGTGKTNKTGVDRSWKKIIESQVDNKLSVSSPTSAQTFEANEESFATASEGSDSEDNRQIQKPKSTYGTSKRSLAVVATKPSRKYNRSTSRKRSDNRRITAPLYSRKDSSTYASGAKRNPFTSGSKPPTKKENEKYEDGVSVSTNKDDVKGDKQSRDYIDSQKKGVKSRNRSDSRKNSTSSRVTGSVTNTRKSSDVLSRMQSKSKIDGKPTDNRDSKNFDSSTTHFRELGPSIPAPPPMGNAWDKPLTATLRTGSPSTQRPVGSNSSGTISVIGQEKSLGQLGEHRAESATLSSDQPSNSVSAEKVTTKVLENLDGSTPPVQTIIFENTNYKTSPADISSKSKYGNQLKNHRFDKDPKLECLESSVSGFGNESSNAELPNNKHDPLQMALFNKNEDVTDMKLDFNFDSSDFSKLTDDGGKSGKAMELSHAMHMVQASTDADLNFKIASVKKVWDGSLSEHYDDKYDGGMTNTSTSFSPSFSSHGSDPNNGPCYSHVDSSGHIQVDDMSGLHSEVVFSTQMQGVNVGYGSSSNCQTVVIKNDVAGSSSNVCKVKPQPQGCGTNIVNAAQSSVIASTLVSQPPPMSSPSYTFSCSTPQPNLSNGNVAANALPQLNFPATFNLPPMPSSPVLFNSSQTAAQTAPGLYPTFQIDNSQVATRSQYGQFSTTYGLPNAALGQTSAFSQGPSLYLPPPSAPPLEMYQPLQPFRIQPQPFGNTQQITSPNTVLISSTTNSLMSSSIKPTNQQISAIGTKTGFQGAQTSPQVYMSFDAATQMLNQSFIPGSQVIQRPANNVVAAGALSASNSFYSSASGAGQTGYYPGTNSQPQTGAAIGLTAFTQSANQSLGPIQNFGSQLQYRSAQQSYLKNSGSGSNLSSDFGSSKTITIPNHDVLNPGFPPTNKRLPPGSKNLQGMPQGLAQHSMTQNAYAYQTSNQMRNNGNTNKGSKYPHPIQRPVSGGNNSSRANGGGGGTNTGNTSAGHRTPVRNNSHQLVNNIQQSPSSAYYSTSSGYGSSKLDASQLDSKGESGADVKLADNIKTMNAKNMSASSNKNVALNE